MDFPILTYPYKGHLQSIPWEMIAPHEAQAKHNHDQTLERLAQRGGLSAYEAVAVLTGRSLRWGLVNGKADEVEANLTLINMVKDWLSAKDKLEKVN